VDNQFFRYNRKKGVKQLVFNATDPEQGTAWHFGHFYSAGCTLAKTTTGPRLTCPTRRRAPVCTDSYASIVAMSSYNDTNYYVAYNNRTGISGVLFLAGSLAYKETWVWRNVPLAGGRSGVELEERSVWGIDDEWAADVNAASQPSLLGRATNKDVPLFLTQFVLHEIQSFGWLPNWLPAVSN